MADHYKQQSGVGPSGNLEPYPPPQSDLEGHGTAPRPSGWMYKGAKIGKYEIWYASPEFQLFMVSMVCFLCPGMFNALTGLGGGGQVDPTAQDHANTALYATFAIAAFFAGTVANRLGIRMTMSLGGLGYSIYAASFLSFNHNKNYAFVIFSGALLGVCAGLLWTGQGAIMMSYPTEDQKGRFISAFWIPFNTGAVIGSLVPLGQNLKTEGGPVNDGTYIALIVLMAAGAILALFLCDADKIQRADGSKVILMKNPSWQSEIKGLWETLYTQPWVICLFPMFFASNIFYTYQVNDFNQAFFNTRTRALNNLLYWMSQIFGALAAGYALDFKVRRTLRAKISLIVLLILTVGIWGGGWAWQSHRVPRAVAESSEYMKSELIDWRSGTTDFVAPMFLFMFYGFYDAVWQTCIYWYIGALSNSGRRTANMTGFYKGIQSAGAAIFWRLDGLKVEYNSMFGATWGILACSLFAAAPVIFFRIQDHVTIEEDLKFSDATMEDVAPTAMIHRRMTEPYNPHAGAASYSYQGNGEPCSRQRMTQHYNHQGMMEAHHHRGMPEQYDHYGMEDQYNHEATPEQIFKRQTY